MVNKKDEPRGSVKKKYTPSTTSRSSSSEKPLASSAASTSKSNSPSTSHEKKVLGSAPKGKESPLKQALVIHHANVQQISVNWFKLLTEHMDAKRAEIVGTPKEPVKPSNGSGAQMSKSVDSGLRSSSPATPNAKAHCISHNDELVTAQSSCQPRLIHPGEVQISQQTILEESKIVSTPNEDSPDYLRYQDQIIAESLEEKKSILSKMFNLSVEEINKLPDAILEKKTETPELRTLLLASMIQSDRLLESVNTNLKIAQNKISPSKAQNLAQVDVKHLVTPNNNRDPPSVPCRQLAMIVPTLLKHLSTLLQTIKATEEEIKRSRIELLRCKAEAGSCSSIVRDSPIGTGHTSISARNSLSTDEAKIEEGVE